jgi:hypothetical protein
MRANEVRRLSRAKSGYSGANRETSQLASGVPDCPRLKAGVHPGYGVAKPKAQGTVIVLLV